MEDLKNILYVEDEEIASDIVRRFLDKLYNVDNAKTAETALTLLEKNKYDLILMDISLRHSISGLDLTRLIRIMPDYIHIPVVAVTAHAMFGDREKILESGCNGYLSKPFTRQELINVVKLNINS